MHIYKYLKYPDSDKYSHSGILAYSPLLSRLRFLEIPPPHLEGICLPSPPPSVVNAPKPEHDGNSPANTIKSGMYQKANSRAKYRKNSKKQHFREFRDFGRGGGGGGHFHVISHISGISHISLIPVFQYICRIP